MMQTTPAHQLPALALFTRQFSIMVNAGVSLVRSLALLEEEALPAYAPAAATMRAQIERGATLSGAMSELPALFPRFYLCMVRAGEVGGVLDIALDHLANLLHEDWTLARTVGSGSLLLPGDHAGPESWDELPATRRTVLLSLFCRAYGMMLSSGVPIVLASLTAADVLPPAQRAAVQQMVEVMRHRGDERALIAELSFLPPIARGMFRIGMETGTLDAALDKLADLYRYQVMYQRAPA
ncbi:MAG TPA: type II secretion system F family protein [Armatimonadota bacterium]|nr:type II secretion system F family protein [Armatimonadota bacterium]HOS43410.1 type II secretion system F family protein [Armatimonadota bacterium]